MRHLYDLPAHGSFAPALHRTRPPARKPQNKLAPRPICMLRSHSLECKARWIVLCQLIKQASQVAPSGGCQLLNCDLNRFHRAAGAHCGME